MKKQKVTLTFGEFAGRNLTDKKVPSDYLDVLRRCNGILPDEIERDPAARGALEAQLDAELARRQWPDMSLPAADRRDHETYGPCWCRHCLPKRQAAKQARRELATHLRRRTVASAGTATQVIELRRIA